MKQLVHEQPPALPLIILGDHLPDVRGPRDAAPLDGALTKPITRGRSPAGAGWLVAIVPVAASAITIGPHSDTPQSGRRRVRRAPGLP